MCFDIDDVHNLENIRHKTSHLGLLMKVLNFYILTCFQMPDGLLNAGNPVCSGLSWASETPNTFNTKPEMV